MERVAPAVRQRQERLAVRGRRRVRDVGAAARERGTAGLCRHRHRPEPRRRRPQFFRHQHPQRRVRRRRRRTALQGRRRLPGAGGRPARRERRLRHLRLQRRCRQAARLRRRERRVQGAELGQPARENSAARGHGHGARLQLPELRFGAGGESPEHRDGGLRQLRRGARYQPRDGGPHRPRQRGGQAAAPAAGHARHPPRRQGRGDRLHEALHEGRWRRVLLGRICLPRRRRQAGLAHPVRRPLEHRAYRQSRGAGGG